MVQLKIRHPLIRLKCGLIRKIECEVSDFDGLLDAIKAGADIVMLDNFTPESVHNSIEKIKKIKTKKQSCY